MAVALSLGAFGCSAFRAPLTCPQRGGPAWTEWSSRHFLLTTDADAETARDTLVRFEALHDTLAYVMQRRPQLASSRVEVVLFDRAADYREFSGERRSGAYFSSRAPGDLEPRPVIVMPRDDLNAECDATLLHELTHRFLHERYYALPPWVDEGFAQYYESLRIDSGRVHLGGPGPIDFSDRPFFWYAWNGNAQQLEVPIDKAPTVKQLVEAERDAFQSIPVAGEKQPDADGRSSAYYAASWRLVHFFANGSTVDRRARFIDFLAAVQRGATAHDAFFATFGGELPRLEQEVHRYDTLTPVPQTAVAAPPPTAAPPPAARALGDTDVHVLWARLFPHEKEGLARAHRELDEALAHSPASPEVQYRRAVLCIEEERFGDAQTAIDKALAARPDEPRYLFARLSIGVLRAQKANTSLKEVVADAASIERLAKTATSAMQLQLAAQLVGRRGHVEEGLRLADRAVATDPLCWMCQQSRAVLLFMARRDDEALVALDRAVALVPEHAARSEIVALRKVIDAARRRAPGATP